MKMIKKSTLHMLSYYFLMKRKRRKKICQMLHFFRNRGNNKKLGNRQRASSLKSLNQWNLGLKNDLFSE